MNDARTASATPEREISVAMHHIELPGDGPLDAEVASLRRAYVAALAFAGFGAMAFGVYLLGHGAPPVVRMGWGTIAAGGITFLGTTNMLRRSS